MAGIQDLAQKSVTDVRECLQSIAQIANKTIWNVYDQSELTGSLVGTKLPGVGVVYEGMRAVETQQKETHRVGLAGELVISINLMYQNESKGMTTSRDEAVVLLDDIRNAMKDRRAPSGHFWRFVVEAPAVLKSGGVMWVQRWSCPVILT